eukprot:gene9896-18489_t
MMERRQFKNFTGISESHCKLPGEETTFCKFGRWLLENSPMTSEELKCYKSLDAYNQFLCGWVKEIGVKVYEDEKRVVLGRVSRKLLLRDA